MTCIGMVDAVKTGCVIQHEGDEKYILAHLVPLKPQFSEQYIIVSMPMAYHSDIAFEYQLTLERGSYNMQVEGGGIMNISHETKTIKTYGKSGGYGEVDPRKVEFILKRHYPDYNIDVKVTNYIRG